MPDNAENLPIKSSLIDIIRKTLEQQKELREDITKYQTLFGFSLVANEAMADFDKLLDLILIAAIDQQKLAETGSIFLLDETKTKITLRRKRGKYASFVQYTEFELGQGIAGIVAKSGQPILINDCINDSRYVPFRSGVT